MNTCSHCGSQGDLCAHLPWPRKGCPRRDEPNVMTDIEAASSNGPLTLYECDLCKTVSSWRMCWGSRHAGRSEVRRPVLYVRADANEREAGIKDAQKVVEVMAEELEDDPKFAVMAQVCRDAVEAIGQILPSAHVDKSTESK